MSKNAKNKKIPLKLILLLILILIAFITGGKANKSCIWPFCRDYFSFWGHYANQSFQGNAFNPSRKIGMNGSYGELIWINYSIDKTNRYGGLQYDQTKNVFIYVDQFGKFNNFDLNGNLKDSQIPTFDYLHPKAIPSFVESDRLGVRDFYLDSLGGLALIVVSEIDSSSNCHKLVVYENEFLNKKTWEKIYSSVCWGFGTSGSVGGGLVKSGNYVYLTIGDNDLFLDPEKKPKNYDVVLETMKLSRVIQINRKNKKVKFFAKGFRNPQGIAISESRTIYTVEHGPQGGDELNLLKVLGDYGYPSNSLGVAYGQFSWPFYDSQKSKLTIPPLYSWVPSIAPSDIEINKNYQGINGLTDCEILISTLRGMSIFFIRLNNGCSSVVNIEELHIGERIRKIALATGNIKAIAFSTDGTNKIGLIKFDPH